MSARTARDKLRVAHELRRRPVVADAFASGRLSYCKVRAVTRVTDAQVEVDEALVALAEAGTVADVERAVRHWQNRADQERGVEDYLRRLERRRLRAWRSYDGMMVLEVVLPLEEGEEALVLLDGGKAGDGGSREPQPLAQRRADTLVELLRAGQEGGGAPGSDRYTLHLVADVDAVADRFGTKAEMLDGSPLCTQT